ncbi:MAG: hypothetical protein COU33_03450 [Candidatus Magasanikbacteria bacterium CG10_big_fil_rev_8_21_14_0_10_43_6]|uniref:Inositol monophosphatase n=1 Tax=Candidatus Magasanikbacteria bacterium CG10_big_fil_rev_8_21_14_0_10_43_6 TaxID=1974650 RepID=A0A2M6W0T3_9BACT|nr:MAG: hypothetical protein COU33_03450 [Candidatus Magasanikbacteria bacterium CG10_big_fil_rev_8_21_14_0_10_43_6]
MEAFLKQIIRDAGQMSAEYFQKGVTFTVKSNLSDLVTEADVAVNSFLIEKIQERYPDHKITSEEEDEKGPGDADYEWIIDPIDGTRNYAKGIPLWCVIIAVVKQGEPYLAAVYSPTGDELFFAKKDHGATMNGLPITVNDKASLDYACGSFSSMGERVAPYGEKIDEFKTFLDNLNHKTNTWRHHFGNMLGLCYVASGGFDFFVQNAGLDHDYIAPVLIAREAGAIVTDCEGNNWQRGRQDIVVAPPGLHEKIMGLFK